mgnify:FL=1
MGCQRLWGLREIKYKLIVYLILLKLDRTYSTSGNLFEQKEEVTHYVGMSKEKIGKVFAYLNSVAFNYTLGNPPKMDKSAFSTRKN